MWSRGELKLTDRVCKHGTETWTEVARLTKSLQRAEQSYRNTRIRVIKDGKQLGPYTIKQLNAEASAGRVMPADPGRIEGSSNWQPLSTVPGVIPASLTPEKRASMFPPPRPPQPHPAAGANIACPECGATTIEHNGKKWCPICAAFVTPVRAKQIRVIKDGQELGPYTIKEVNAEAAAGRVTPADLACIEGRPNLHALSTIPGFIFAARPRIPAPLTPANIACSECGATTIEHNGKRWCPTCAAFTTPPPVRAKPQPPPNPPYPVPQRIRVIKDGRQLGPYTIKQLNAEAAAGRVTSADPGCIEGSSNWQPLSTVPGFKPPLIRPASEATKGDTTSAPNDSLLVRCGKAVVGSLVAVTIYWILLAISGYDVGRSGMPSWWFVPVALFYIVIRSACSKKKAPSKPKE